MSGAWCVDLTTHHAPRTTALVIVRAGGFNDHENHLRHDVGRQRGTERSYEEAVERVKAGLGKDHPFVVNGEERWGDGFYEERSPIDSEIVVGRYAQATEADVNDAVAAAKTFFATWSTTPWSERVETHAHGPPK